MAIKLACGDYGFECSFELEGENSLSLIEKLRDHFEQEHGIEYSVDAVIQMLINRGYSRESIKND